MRLIDKDALVAKIEKLKEIYSKCPTRNTYEDALKEGRMIGYKDAMDEIKTPEVKQVDLEKEYKDFVDEDTVYNKLVNGIVGKAIAKHFFELGFKANQENNIIGTLEREVKIDAGGYPYIDCDIEFYDYDKDIPLAKEGDKVKIVVIKEE